MGHFSYCLSLSLIHSIWQSALLLGLYTLYNNTAGNSSPAAKRNVLLGMILLQVFLSISTCYVYYIGSVSALTSSLTEKLSGLVQTGSFLKTFAPWISAAYALAVLYKISTLIYHWNHFKNGISSQRLKPGSDIRLFTKVKAMQFGIRRRVSIWYSNKVNGPVTFGYFRPVILLPVALVNNLTLEETESLIIHELTHIRHHDYLVNWLLVFAETAYFFNPFVGNIARKIRLEREKNCDVHVLQFSYPPIGYAETLFKAASLKKAHTPFYLAAAAGNSQLMTRILFFTREKNLVFSKRNHTAITTTMAMLLFILNLFILHTSVTGTANISTSTANLTPVMATITARYSENKPLQFVAKAVAPNITKNAETTNIPEPTIVKKEHSPLTVSGSKQEITIDETDAETVNYAIPATLDENEIVKEITLKEENSETGETTTKVFQVKYTNGIIETRLLLTVVESRPVYDSAHLRKDSTILINPVQ